MTMFRDRVDAGRHLAQVVRAAGLGGDRTVVLGLPRGGVPVAAEVGVALGAPLDVIVVRKLGVPFQPELAMGAIGEDGIRVENGEAVGSSAVSAVEFAAIEQRERGELNRRALRYREGRPRLDLEGRCAVIVDDGIATGSTARAACHVAHAHGASRVVLAVPVAPAATVSALQDACDAMLCVAHPDPFFAVGEWYHDFTPTSDDEVNELLRRAQL
jgi:putative phosphoribosyl transferase